MFDPSAHLRWFAVFFALCAGAAGGERFVVRAWQSEHGLPSNSIRAVAQAADGYLWVATAEGVVRFDGVRFSRFAEEPDGLLAQRPTRGLFALPNGDVWIPTARAGLLRWDGCRLHEAWEEADATVPAARIVHGWQVVSDGAAGAYLERGEELFHAGRDGALRPVEKTAELTAKLRASIEAQARRESALAAAGTALELRDRRERLWTSVPRAGLSVSERGAPAEPVALPGFGPGSRITALLEDREGSLWIATGGNGLFQVRPSRVEVVGIADGLSDRTVFALLEDRAGALWAANKSGGIDRLAEGKVTHYGVGDGGAKRPISALCEDRDGTLWAATRNGSVFRWRDGGFRIATGTAMPVTQVVAIAGDAEGRLWLGGEQGLASWADGVLTRHGAEQGIVSPEITALAFDDTGELWAGSGDGVLYRGRSGAFGKVGELSGRAVSSIWPDAEGAVWITTLGAGLFRWRDGALTRFAEPQGLPDARLTCVLDDGTGHLWLGSLAGIFRVAKSELAAIAGHQRGAAEWLTLDRSDGLLSRECTGAFQPAGWRSRDGTVRFPTVQGIATIRPAALELNRVPPPVVIEEARARGLARGPTALHAGPGRARLEFRYTALSFTAPEKVRFRTRLEGLETAWREVGTQRSAAYEAVPPGRYRFHVAAANGDGVWNETGAALAVHVRPHFWETAWFKIVATVVAALVAVGSGALISRARLRGRLLRLELQTSRETERARIAQDLHDDLGASLTEISLLAHLATEDKGRGRDPLPEIATKAHDLVGALDEIVWAINPRHDTLASLADYLAAFAAEFLDAAGIALRLDLPPELPAQPLVAEQRHGLFLAVREALNNAAKHSGANEVRLRLRLEAGELTVAVEDNGRGLPDEVAASSEGLRNLRTRLAGIGGTCRIESDARGTSVCFSLPLSAT